MTAAALDVHTGVSRWRERWQARRGGRCKGVWDAALARETLVLRDGRRLTYFLDGPLLQRQSWPHIFVFHAMFLSGNAFLMAQAPTDYVLVCVNRPGYFGSDPPESDAYGYDTFASDIEQLADYLGVTTFLVAGHSSGGPCSLACAAHLPQRIRALGILSGDPEYAHETVPNKRRINAWLLGQFLPFFLKRVLCCLPMARNGVKGLQNDYRLETALYSFHTEAIEQPAVLFVGEKDQVLPLEVSRHVHKRLQQVQLRIIPAVGHMGLLRDAVLCAFFEALLKAAASKPRDEGDRATETPQDAATVEMV
jgi:pimeloyl-ACP methyl ester carboxylesterase